MFKPFKVNVFGCKSLNNSRMRAMRWLVKLLWPLVCVLRFAESRSNPDETRLRKHLFDPAEQTEDLKTTPIRHFHEVMNISVATVITKLIALVKHIIIYLWSFYYVLPQKNAKTQWYRHFTWVVANTQLVKYQYQYSSLNYEYRYQYSRLKYQYQYQYLKSISCFYLRPRQVEVSNALLLVRMNHCWQTFKTRTLLLVTAY